MLVTPPPDLLPELLADLVTFANSDTVDPIAQAAIVHAQFEVSTRSATATVASAGSSSRSCSPVAYSC